MVRNFFGFIILFTLFGSIKVEAMKRVKTQDDLGLKNKPCSMASVARNNDEDPFTIGLVLYNKGKYKESLLFFNHALFNGHVEANKIIGHVENRIGFQFTTKPSRDYEEARQWFNQAIDKGNPAAHYNFGIMLLKGHGTEKNFRAAVPYLERARDLKHPKAKAVLQRVYYHLGMESMGYNVYEALVWFRNAYTSGHVDAKKMVGETERIIGYEVEKEGNFAEAKEWYQKAIANGDTDAPGMLKILEVLMKK